MNGRSIFFKIQQKGGAVALDPWSAVVHVTQGMVPAYSLGMQL
jgi:hypothetical protein